MHVLRRTITWIAVAAAWSCGGASVTGVDATPGISSIAVSPSSLTLALGGEAPLQATVLDASGHSRADLPVVWSVRDTAIARVSSSGVVTARGVGNTQIAASAGGLSAIATLAVQPPPVASVVVQPLTQALVLGEGATYTATPRDVNGTPLSGRVVTWTSSDDAVATVSQDGQVATHAVGTATVTATSEGVSGSATVTVSPVPVASVSVQPASAALTVGATFALTALAKDATGAPLDRVVTWSSDDPAVASVSTSGVVTAVAPGSATITARSDGKSGTAAVVVSRAAVSSVSIAPANASLAVGGTVALASTVKDAAGTVLTDREVSWISSDLHVAMVSASGVVTGVTPGSATISAASEGKVGTSAVTVLARPIASVTVQPATANVQVGGTTALTATVKDAVGAVVPDAVVTWTSGSVAVATVSTTGVVTGRAAGTTTISATSGGHTGSATVTVVPVPVASVALQPSRVALQPGETATLTATTKSADSTVLTGRVVTFTSDNSGVARVSSDGVVSAIAPGSATIAATSEGVRGTAAVVVTLVPVGSVALLPTSASVVAGQTVALSATVLDTAGRVVTDRVVSWTSSDIHVAVVSTTGIVTGVAAGTAAITATSEGRSGTSTVTVIVPPIDSVSVQPSLATVQIGRSTTLTATVRDVTGAIVTDRAVSWASGNVAVATVSSTGVVTGVAAGTAIISATSGGKSGSATVTVVPVPVGSVSVAPSSATLVPTQVVGLSAVVRDENSVVVTDRAVTWASSNSGVATVSPSGVVTAVAPGTATITATSEGRTGAASITVAPMPVGSVIVSPPTATVTAGQTVSFSATVRDTSGAVVTDRVVTWRSSNTAVATVSAAGVVTGVTPGVVTITATSEARSGSAAVTVLPVPVATVTLDPTSVTLEPGQTAPLSATTKSADGTVLTGRTVTFSSDNVSVASVSSDGIVTGVAPGAATITATSEGKTATTTVTVQPTVASVVVSPNEVFIRRNGTVQLSATAYDASNNVIIGRAITWSTSDDHLATVSATGLVTARRAGAVTITATIDGKSGSARVTITN